MNAAWSVPGTSRKSMRVSWPPRPNRSCAAPMSITARAPPLAATVPATWTPRSAAPTFSCTVAPLPKALRAAAFRKTWLGANTENRDAPEDSSGVWAAACDGEGEDGEDNGVVVDVAGRGISAGAMVGSTSASTPTTRIDTVGTGAPAVATPVARVFISSTGLANVTRASRTTRANSASSKLPCAARNSRSGCPLTDRTALANSSSADALIRCTEKARATPSMTATIAAALRHG